MSENTCGSCPHLVVQDLWRGMYTASCGKTDGLIVPHEWTGETIILWRVPDFCQNPDKVKSEKRAPRKDWVVMNVKEV